MSEDNIKFCNDLINWGREVGPELCKDLGDNNWAIRSPFGVLLVIADDYNDAYGTFLDKLEEYIQVSKELNHEQ